MFKNLQLIKKAMPQIALAALVAATSLSSSFAQTTPVQAWGKLKVTGKNLQTQDGKNVVLRGMSLGWTSFPESKPFFNASTVASLAKNWKATVVRAPLGIAPGSPNVGYEADASQGNLINTVVDAAIANGIYVIVDWHVHAGKAQEAKAITYFDMMSKKYGASPNVIYEIWNEPTTETWTGDIKPYAEKVIAAIRKNDPDNVIIVGTRQWSQVVSEVIPSPITSSTNIMYTVHFYAADPAHQVGGYIGSEVKKAVAANIPVFVTEYGTVSPDGNGGADAAATKAWYDYMDQNNISYCGWQVNTKAEGSSALNVGQGIDGTVTASGKIMKDMLIAKAPTNLVPLSTTANEDELFTETISLVSPNPSSSDFTITESGEFTYTISDIAGRVILSGKGIDNAIAGNELRPGTYIVSVDSGKRKRTAKMIKN